MGISSQANLTMREGVSPLLEPAWNFGSSDIPVGQLVARDIAASDSSATADALRRRKSHGIAVPATDNVQRLWGIVAGVNGRPAKAGAAAQVCTGGLCQAWIDVPATTAIAEGVPLIMSTAWNTTTTPDSVTYYPYLTPLYANTPTIDTAAVVEPANPVAYLREAIASGSARQVLAWVDLVPYRRPMRWSRTFNMSGTAGLPIAATGLILLEAEGPGSIDRLIGQAADAGSGGGPLTVDVMISPKGATPAQLSVLSSLLTIAHDSTNLGVFGAGALYNGDTDAAAFSLGTNGLQPVFAALVNRQFNGKAMLVANVAAVNTALVHLSVQAHGWYY